MKSSRSAFFCLALTAATFVSAHNARVARACSATTPMSFYGGYVDAYDQPGNIYYVFWGYGTYGDPQSFQPAANAIFNNVALLESLGIGATRFNRVTIAICRVRLEHRQLHANCTNAGCVFLVGRGWIARA